jgi:DNA-directed RNA polymerase subunit F
VSNARIYDPIEHNSKLLGWKTAFLQISRSKNVNNIGKHIKKFFSIESKKMGKLVGNLLSEAVVLKKLVSD